MFGLEEGKKTASSFMANKVSNIEGRLREERERRERRREIKRSREREGGREGERERERGSEGARGGERWRVKIFYSAGVIIVLLHGPYIRLVVLGDVWYWECYDHLPDILHWDILSPGLKDE